MWVESAIFRTFVSEQKRKCRCIATTFQTERYDNSSNDIVISTPDIQKKYNHPPSSQRTEIHFFSIAILTGQETEVILPFVLRIQKGVLL